MRIIAGDFRGRKLLAPEGDTTRPITDRVKQSLFDIVSPRLPGANLYDCFAGTGSLGLEGLSRGAAHCVFFESDRSAVARLRTNIQTLKLDDRASVVTQDLFAWFDNTDRPPATTADLLFLDPPYRFLRDRTADLATLAANIRKCHLTPGGLVILRHSADDSLSLPHFRRTDQRVYGGMMIEFLEGTDC